MADKSTAMKTGLTPAKTALIVVLSFVLVGVLYQQYGGSSCSAGRRADRARPAPIRSGDARDHRGRNQQNWQKKPVRQNASRGNCLGRR